MTASSGQDGGTLPWTDPTLWHPQHTKETEAAEEMGFQEQLQRLD